MQHEHIKNMKRRFLSEWVLKTTFIGLQPLQILGFYLKIILIEPQA